MIKARIYEAGVKTTCGYVYTAAELAEGVANFNRDSLSELVMVNHYLGLPPLDLASVAATVTLYIEGNNVIANVKFVDTPQGRMMTKLYEANITIKILPISQRTLRDDGTTGFIIHRLVIPEDPLAVPEESHLMRIKRWVTGAEERYVLFDLKEHKY